MKSRDGGGRREQAKKKKTERRWEGTDEIKCEEEEERDGGIQGYFGRR